MPIATASFMDWTRELSASGDELSLKEMSVATGIPRPTLSLQRTRGRVQPTSVMQLARAYGKNPALELGRFKGYETLAPIPKRYPDSHLATLVAPFDLVKMILHEGGYLRDIEPLSAMPDMTSLGRWGQVIATPERLAQAGISVGDLNQAFRSRSVSIDRLLSFTTALKEPPHLGILAMGELRSTEIGLSGSLYEITKSLPIDALYDQYLLARNLVDAAIESVSVDHAIRRNLS